MQINNFQVEFNKKNVYITWCNTKIILNPVYIIRVIFIRYIGITLFANIIGFSFHVYN